MSGVGAATARQPARVVGCGGRRRARGRDDRLVNLRAARAADAPAIQAVLLAAFPTGAEARLVDALRRAGNLTLSLVAELDGAIVGHAAFSPVTLGGERGGFGLAPVAVRPGFQDRGLGSALIRAGLDRCRELAVPFVVVLGHPTYYPRFGFERADRRGLDNVYGATDAFFVLELAAGGIPAGGGLVRYGAEFAAFG
ncbi:MAG: N-acetyltransferase [Planctomycetes bacterium]|nr:N-acetyltransferase [Planctomycetota bacterium]